MFFTLPERSSRLFGRVLRSHEPAATQLRELRKALRTVEGLGLGGVVRRQLQLSHLGKAAADLLQQLRADALTLAVRQDQKVLYQHDGLPVADGADKPQQAAVLVIGGQGQQGMGKALPQRLWVVGIGRSAHAGVQG